MLYFIGANLSRLIAFTFGRWKVIGRKNVPKSGPVILAPNHISFADPPVVGGGVKGRPVHFMAKEELFKVPVMGKIIAGLGAFPVRQNTADRAAIRKAMEYLEKGEIVCIFPEGTRSPDGNLQEALPGLGMIALKTKAPVVPVALIDTDKMLRRHSAFLHFAHVKAIYGEPITFDDLYEQGMNKEALEQVGTRTMSAIAELLKQHR